MEAKVSGAKLLGGRKGHTKLAQGHCKLESPNSKARPRPERALSLAEPLGTPITLRQGARVIEDSRRLRVVVESVRAPLA